MSSVLLFVLYPNLANNALQKFVIEQVIKSWYDQTGNLRSSVGYVIAHNKNIIQYSTFNQMMQGSEGVKTGKDLAEELAKRYSNNYVLIVVAGMNYAEFVEAMDNKDVLASTELWAREQVPLMLEKLKRQIAK